MRKLAIIISSILIISLIMGIVPGNAAVVYYGYDPDGKYIVYPEPYPDYWSYRYRSRTIQVKTATITISIEGLPAELSTNFIVDGSSMDQINGEGVAKFQIKEDEVRSFKVDSYVIGRTGERYYCKSNTWASEKGKEVEVEQYRRTYTYVPYYYYTPNNSYPHYNYYYYPYYYRDTITVIEPFDQAHSFRYEAEYQLSVQNEFGGSVPQSGWYAEDSTINLNTKSIIEISPNTRYKFNAWTINGEDVNIEQVEIKMNKPHSISAKYTKQYYLAIKTDHGSPSGENWYDEGTNARIQIEKSLPIGGFLGTLGAKRIFENWSGDFSSESNVADVTMNSPKLINANWIIDNTWPIVAIVLIIAAIVIALILIAIFFGHSIKQAIKKSKAERIEMTPLEILNARYANGEITRKEYMQMKSDLKE
jgi:uncharacterized membrane protein